MTQNASFVNYRNHYLPELFLGVAAQRGIEIGFHESQGSSPPTAVQPPMSRNIL